MGTILDSRLSLDQRQLSVVSAECLLHGIVSNASKLLRSVLHFSKTYDDDARVSAAAFSRSRKMALGLDNSKLLIYNQIPTSTLSRAYQVYSLPSMQFEPLPVERIEWLSEDRVVILCRRGFFPTCHLLLWSLATGMVEESVQTNNITCWAFSGSSMFWCTTGGFIHSKKWSTQVFTTDATRIVCLDSQIAVFSPFNSNKVVLVDSHTGVISRQTTIQNSGAAVVGVFTSNLARYVVLSDENGAIHLLVPTEDGPSLLWYTRC